MLSFNGFGILNDFSTDFSESVYVQTGIFFLILFVASDLISLPFSWYNTFVIEEKYGFNKTTYKTFFIDKVKGYLLTVIIGGGILFGIMYIVDSLISGFWIWLWLALTSLMILLLVSAKNSFLK